MLSASIFLATATSGVTITCKLALDLPPSFASEVLGLNKEATLQVETEAEKDLTAFLIKELK